MAGLDQSTKGVKLPVTITCPPVANVSFLTIARDPTAATGQLAFDELVIERAGGWVGGQRGNCARPVHQHMHADSRRMLRMHTLHACGCTM